MKRVATAIKGYANVEGTETSRKLVAPRGFNLNAITEAPVIRATPTMDIWGVDIDARMASITTHVSDPMWHAIQTGQPIAELIKASPEEVIIALRDHSVKRLGTFTVTDAEVLLAFGSKRMLTRGSDTAREESFVENWRELIRDKVNSISHKEYYFEGAWEQQVELTAYVVHIKDAAASQKDGLLHSLVKKSQSGGAGGEIWTFPAVEAVIEYKWHYWAKFYFYIEFALYIGWVLCFSLFLITYTQGDLKKDFDDQNSWGRFLKIEAHFFDTLAVILMIPFMFIEFQTLRRYGMRWFTQMWNLIDSLAYFLQAVITYGHITGGDIFGSKRYEALLAIQCVLLFVKIQYFSRVFGEGASFIELLVRVVFKVRAFFYFIILTMISVALALTVLFKRENDANGDEAEMKDANNVEQRFGQNATAEMPDTDQSCPCKEKAAEDFENIVRSMVTTYAVLLGDFNSEYVFEGSNRGIKGIFFVLFQVLMSITVLNLLIAVVTESYTYIMTMSAAMFHMSKAQAMDELEVSLPQRFRPTLKPYCHFLVVSKKEDNASAESNPASPITRDDSGTSNAAFGSRRVSSIDDIKSVKNDVNDLKANVQELKEMMKAISRKLDENR